MSEEKVWLSCKEAAELLNCTDRNITTLITRGKLSAKKDENGKYFIQKAEFFRVYPEAMKREKERSDEKSGGKYSIKLLEERVRHLQEMIDEKKKHNDFLIQQLDNYTHEKSKMLDAINSHTRLLEYKEVSGKSKDKVLGKKMGSNWRWPFKKS